MRRVRALVAGLAVGAAVFALRRVGALEGIPAAAFAVLLALTLPWSSGLSRRLLLAGAVFLGWMPLLWWLRLPASIDRVGLALAITSGALCGWVFWAADVRGRARRLIPQASPVDAMPFAAAVIGIWATWPLLASPGGDRTLQLLTSYGFDHAAHFAMTMVIRTQGAISPMLGRAPDGTIWGDTTYPQHFHATVAAVTQLLNGPAVRSGGAEVLAYGRSLALVQVITVVLLTAGVAQLPTLRRCAVVAWPLAAMIIAAFLFGPGSVALSLGFPNFVLACATVGLAALLAVPMTGEAAPLRVFAVGGLIVATVHGWALLAPLAIVASSVALVPFVRARWPHQRVASFATVLALVATLAASAAVIPILASVRGGVRVLSIGGGGPPVSISLLLLSSGMAIATAIAVYVRRESVEGAQKGVMLASIPVTGVLMLVLLASYQLVKTGALSYYFDKFAVAVTLISIVMLAASVALHIGPPLPRRGRIRRSVAYLAATVASLAALQLFGFVGPLFLMSTLPNLDVAPGVTYRAQAKAIMRVPAPAAQRLLRAAAITQTRPLRTTVYVAAMPGDPGLVLAQNWQVAIASHWYGGSRADNKVSKILFATAAWAGVDETAAVVEKMLDAAPDLAVVAAPEIAYKIRERLPLALGSRVITW